MLCLRKGISDWKYICVMMMCLRLPLISLQDIYWITEQDKNIKKIRISQNPLTFLERSRSCSFKEGPVKSLIVFIQAYIFPSPLEWFSWYLGSMVLNDSYRNTVLLKFIRFFPVRIPDVFYSAPVHSALPFRRVISQTHIHTNKETT